MMHKKYRSLGKVALQDALAYRAALFVYMISTFLFMVATFYLWQAIFAGRGTLADYSWPQMRAYLLIAFLSNALVSTFTEGNIAYRILDGSLAMDLLKPLDFQQARLAETLGATVFEGGLSVILLAIALVLFAGGAAPPTAPMTTFFAISLLLSLLVKFNIVYLAGLLCFWTTSATGVQWTRTAIANFFSGALVPLALFPHWLERITLLLPFQAMVYTPTAIYLGRVDQGGALRLLGLQLFWIVALWFAAKLVWNVGVRRVTIQGG